jgi:dihydropyrimidinase
MYDLTVRNATVATATDTFAADVGVTGGRIAAIGRGLAAGDDPARHHVVQGLHQ